VVKLTGKRKFMERAIITVLTGNFEAYVHNTSEGVEFWLARDLQYLPGYDKWVNFQNVISKAKIACEISGQKIIDHFADVGKMVDIGSGAQNLDFPRNYSGKSGAGRRCQKAGAKSKVRR
jgi:hypothetical protein